MGPLCVTADIFHIHKLGLLETQRMTQIPGDICYTYDPSIVHSTEKKTEKIKGSTKKKNYGDFSQTSGPPPPPPFWEFRPFFTVIFWSSWKFLGDFMVVFRAMVRIKMTGETPEVRSDKRKPRILLRHRTS